MLPAVLPFVVLCRGAGVAQALDAGKSLTQYSHRIWGREEGLLQPSIYAIHQSRDGYIWLGTQEGLIRFSGLRFRDFTHNGETPFRNTLVRSIAEDRDQNLWIGTIGAGLAFAGKDGSLIRYNRASGFPSNDVTCVAPDLKGSLWACTGAGLVEFSKGRMRVITTRRRTARKPRAGHMRGVRWHSLGRRVGFRAQPFHRVWLYPACVQPVRRYSRRCGFSRSLRCDVIS